MASLASSAAMGGAATAAATTVSPISTTLGQRVLRDHRDDLPGEVDCLRCALASARLLLREPRDAGPGHLLGGADALAGHPVVAAGDQGAPFVAADQLAQPRVGRRRRRGRGRPGRSPRSPGGAGPRRRLVAADRRDAGAHLRGEGVGPGQALPVEDAARSARRASAAAAGRRLHRRPRPAPPGRCIAGNRCRRAGSSAAARPPAPARSTRRIARRPAPSPLYR